MLGSGEKRTQWPPRNLHQIPHNHQEIKKRGGGSMKQTPLHLVSIFLDATQEIGQPNCLVRARGRDDFNKS